MYQIAIVGAGPAGLSAAARAAERDRRAKRSTPSYVLLEGFNAHAKTIQRYQKGKHVMAEPGFLDLRSDLEFGAGSREKVLGKWGEGLQKGGAVRYRVTPLFERVFGLSSLSELPRLDDLAADGDDLRARLEEVAGRRGA